MQTLNKVRAAILHYHLFAKGETVVVGVSGGPDSLALLHLLNELSSELQTKLHVAHLNHQLRGGESDADAAFVADTAAAMGLPATIEARPVADYGREHHLSLEEAARLVRYRFLGEVAARAGSRTVAVGHNADDQAETVLMRVLRGAGLAGLRGMSYISPIPFADSQVGGNASPILLVRPMLDVARSEIEAYCGENGLTPRLDDSNSDTSLFRNRLRREVIPYLEQLNPNLREVLVHSAHALADDYEYLHEVTESAFAQVAIPEVGAMPSANLARFIFDLEKWRALPPSLQRTTLREAVRRLRQGLRNINWAHIEDARRVASEKGVGAEATLPQGLVLVVGYDELTIGETLSLPEIPLLHVEWLDLRTGATVELPGSGWQVKLEQKELAKAERRKEVPEPHENKWAAMLDAEIIRGRLRLRTRIAGERFEPSGLGGHHKSLHEFMIEEKIPRHVRDLLPILADEEKVLWVCGYRIDERAGATEQTRERLDVEFSRLSDSD